MGRRFGLASVVSVLSLCAAVSTGIAADPPDKPEGKAEQRLEDVTVQATHLDEKALSHAVINFVDSHAAPNGRSGLIGRWTQNVCPFAEGLKPAFNQYVTDRIMQVVKSVGAPNGHSPKGCLANVVIVFTDHPQATLDDLAKNYHVLLGYYDPSQEQKVVSFSRPIQAWYLTGTRSFAGGYLSQLAPMKGTGVTQDLPIGMHLDTDPGPAPGGAPGSYFGDSRRSEFQHVTIIVDSRAVTSYPLASVADYVAVLALTRMTSLDGCNPLPSIIDLLAADCPIRAGVDALTAADKAYLRALYSSNLERNLNIAQADVRNRLMQEMSSGGR